MITLRKMDEDEFSDFHDYFVADYAIEIEKNYKKNKEMAHQLAEKELRNDLPEGVNTDNNVLLCIELTNQEVSQIVGYLWYKIDDMELSAFIYDFYVKPEYRNRGYGKMSMNILEKKLKIDGMRQIKLRVALTNEKALKLYKELEFYITGINMAKSLINDEES